MTLSCDAKTCQDFETSANLEWLCANGLGGYASGSVSGANTRKYHGYMVVAARPPVDRFVMLSRVEDRVSVGDDAFDLSTDEFPDIVHPQGYRSVVSFTQGAGPVWRYEVGGAIIEKSLIMVHGEDTLVVLYKLISAPAGKAVRLTVQPMFAGRDFHATIQAQYRPNWLSKCDDAQPDILWLSAAECPVKIALTHNAAHFSSHPCWWYNFVFRQERMRGYPDRDDLWTPGTLMFDLNPGQPSGFICATKPVPFAKQEQLVAAEETRHQQLYQAFAKIAPPAKDEFLAQLSVAADQFLVRRGVVGAAGNREMSVIAGYPWFEDWGRDTFISLPGLTLVTGRWEVARSILATFADHLRRGLLPNRFPDKATTPEYHTVDAAMWFVHAAYSYWRYSDDGKFLSTYLYRPLCEIMDYYRDGTDFGIRMEPDGLIRAGEPQVQLTWMDAKVGDWVVTPRHGKPVEINALWYNNLRV
ncbi:MAG: amylo-alpha-1,6-glucosidase, partial [Phycisphaerae bacterium]